MSAADNVYVPVGFGALTVTVIHWTSLCEPTGSPSFGGVGPF
ncbi:MAG: hypothetical protein ACM3OO_04115 [Planctomycetaceae bacterium]